MSRMKDYYELSQLLHWLSSEALEIMLQTAGDDHAAEIIRSELKARGYAQD